NQRPSGLEPQIREVWIVARDVGRVGDDERETLARDRREPAAVAEIDVEVEFRRVPLCRYQGRKIGIDGDNPGPGALEFHCNCDGPRTGSKIQKGIRLFLQDEVNEQFRLGPGYEHRGIDRKIQAVELLAP